MLGDKALQDPPIAKQSEAISQTLPFTAFIFFPGDRTSERMELADRIQIRLQKIMS